MTVRDVLPMRPLNLLCTLVLAIAVAGCASSRRSAPVEERGFGVRPLAPLASASAPEAAASTPLVAEGPRAGYHVVRPGDTLIRIGLETGQNWRDIARWNGIDNTNVLEVGQTLRVIPPGIDPTVVGARPVAAPGRVEARPLDGPPDAAASAPMPEPVAVVVPEPAAAPAAATPAEARTPDDDVPWMWPAKGAVIAGFDDANNKGLSIAGTAGEAVLAAADGRVVYAGTGLRGYGNLVIIKHNNTYLTAYAHNRTLLVKEDQIVRRGQKIAEMGSTDADRVKLHFEIRKQGKPIDPAKLLPPR